MFIKTWGALRVAAFVGGSLEDEMLCMSEFPKNPELISAASTLLSLGLTYLSRGLVWGTPTIVLCYGDRMQLLFIFKGFVCLLPRSLFVSVLASAIHTLIALAFFVLICSCLFHTQLPSRGPERDGMIPLCILPEVPDISFLRIRLL